MQLTRFTDYSLKVLIYLGLHQNEWVTIRQISDSYDISRNHLMKVVSFLAGKNYLESQRGPGGGIKLSLLPGDINLAEVIMDAEGDMNLVQCFSDGERCVLTPSCRLKVVLSDALEAFLDTLRQLSLADIIEPRKELADLLGIPMERKLQPA